MKRDLMTTSDFFPVCAECGRGGQVPDASTEKRENLHCDDDGQRGGEIWKDLSGFNWIPPPPLNQKKIATPPPPRRPPTRASVIEKKLFWGVN